MELRERVALVTGECLTVDGGEQHGHVRDRFTDTAPGQGPVRPEGPNG